MCFSSLAALTSSSRFSHTSGLAVRIGRRSAGAYSTGLIVLTMPVRLGTRSSRYLIRGFKAYTIRMRILSFLHRLRWTVSDTVYQLQDNIEMRALQWALATVDDDDDIETLVEGISGYLTSPTSKNAPSIIQDLLGRQQQHHPLGQHISRFIQTCIPEGFRVATENVRKRRAFICLDTVRCLTEVCTSHHSPPQFLGSRRGLASTH
ncbi:hypothetical protein BC826DRAFT_941222 [Russula brevipes]|nr:hypothetical protein BC826DRAFT_941222 [Russula brevipes]